MGSLMAGWDSPVLGDDKKAHARRNRSLTKEEVEAFWKQRRRPEDAGGELTSPLASPPRRIHQESPFGSLEKKARSSSPAARGASSSPRVRVDGFLPVIGDDGGDAADDSPSKSRDWWTRSNWAFLNEPPLEEPSARAKSYTPQFHVARIATGDA